MLNEFINHWLYRFSAYLRCRLIKINGEPYLERYYLGSVFGRHVYLHRFLASDDPAQGVHDHPWMWSVSLIVCGRYLEVRRWGVYLKNWFNVLGADTFHRVKLLPGVYTWSVFLTGPRKPGNVWGMLRRVDTSTVERGDTASLFVPYDYGAPGNNPLPGKWWETELRGHAQAREPECYIRDQWREQCVQTTDR